VAIQVNPRLARLWLADNIRQYGYRRPIRLDSLTEPELRILDYLEAGITASQVQSLSNLTRAQPAVVSKLLERMTPVISESGRLPAGFSSAEIDTKFSELARLFSVPGDLSTAIAQRRSARVFIEKMGRAGLVLSKALSASEVGRLLTFDQVRVRERDCLPLGHPRSSIGKPRAISAKELLPGTALEFHSRRTSALGRVSVAVLISNDITDPASYQPWMARDIPHISVCFDEEGVEISPLVIPGESPCLGCIERAKFESDPNWKTIAPQLLALERSNEDSAMILFATGVVTNLVLNLIDQGKNGEPKAIRLERSGEISAFQPSAIGCGCRGER